MTQLAALNLSQTTTSSAVTVTAKAGDNSTDVSWASGSYTLVVKDSGGNTLTLGTDYSVSGNVITILKTGTDTYTITYNGEYTAKSEDRNKCYIQNDNEIANFSLNFILIPPF